MRSSRELLAVRGVRKGYLRGGRWTDVLVDVSLEARSGEIGAVVGGRLVGKTTLLKAAAGIEALDGGEVWLDGQDLFGLSARRRARLLGHEIVWVDRDGPGLDVEVSRFVGWPLALHGRGRREVERVAAQGLERVGASGCVGQRWGDISDTERVLVGLARGFAGSPKLVVIDDLLDVLVPCAIEGIFDLLRSLVDGVPSGCAVLMSVSQMESAVFADLVWSLTRKATLKPVAGQSRQGGRIIPFPKQLRDGTPGARKLL